MKSRPPNTISARDSLAFPKSNIMTVQISSLSAVHNVHRARFVYIRLVGSLEGSTLATLARTTLFGGRSLAFLWRTFTAKRLTLRELSVAFRVPFEPRETGIRHTKGE